MGTDQSAVERRSLRYIRLAAFFAGQPPEVDRLVLSIQAIEDVIGASLPMAARFPSWWRNDEHRVHSKAWMSAGWLVRAMNGPEQVEFVRSG